MSGVKTYLQGYNVAMIFGWACILVVYIISGLSSGFDPKVMYPKVSLLLSVFQFGAVLEVVHVAVGWVKSPVFTTFVQVLSRIAIVAMLQFVEESRAVGFLLLGIAWSVTEIVRYSFYAFKCFDKEIPYPLLWCRYSFFIVLYPIGVSGEVLTLIYSLKFFHNSESAHWMSYLIYINILIYIPGLYMLYTYMLSQRKKALGHKNPNKPVEGAKTD